MESTEAQTAVPSPQVELAPVSALERIELIDILRGFALFGVLVANMKGYSLPMNAYFGFGADWPALTAFDRAIDEFILYVIKGKFLSLFAVLFGLGLSVQMMRAEARGRSAIPRYLRRLLVLLMFGVAHVMLFWFGDILHTYALVGFLLVLFHKLSVKILGRIIGMLLLAMMLGGFANFLGGQLRPAPAAPPASIQQFRQKQSQESKLAMERKMQEEVRIFATGTYREQVALRGRQWIELYGDPGTIFYFLFVLHLFLMGLYAGKRRLFQDIEANKPFLKGCLWFGAFCVLAGLARWMPNYPEFPAANFVRGMLRAFSGYMFFFYAAGIALLVHRSTRWQQFFGHLAPIGRMALTNYLSHTLIASAIFYSWGLGYFGKMGSAWGLVLSLAIFTASIPLCAWWLKHYQFGPVEWLWRSLTYGKAQPMKLKPAPPAESAAIA